MINTDIAFRIRFGPIGVDDRQVDECETMMLVVEGQKGHCRVLMLHPGVEYAAIPLQHVGEATGAVDHVGEGFGRSGHGMFLR
jgi:hypothetical protein